MKLKLGDIVHIEFLDHCQTDDLLATMPVETFGRVAKEDSLHIWTVAWGEKAGLTSDAVTFCTVKSTITRLRKLKG